MKKKITALTILILAMCFVSVNAEAFYVGNASIWAYSVAIEAAELGLAPERLNGADLTLPATKEEVIESLMLLYIQAKELDPSYFLYTDTFTTSPPFDDTYNPYIIGAYTLGVLEHEDLPSFYPNEPAAREWVAYATSRTISLIYPAFNLSIDGAPAYEDIGDAAWWAVDHILILAKYGLYGDYGNEYRPKEHMKREILIGSILDGYKLLQSPPEEMTVIIPLTEETEETEETDDNEETRDKPVTPAAKAPDIEMPDLMGYLSGFSLNPPESGGIRSTKPAMNNMLTTHRKKLSTVTYMRYCVVHGEMRKVNGQWQFINGWLNDVYSLGDNICRIHTFDLTEDEPKAQVTLYYNYTQFDGRYRMYEWTAGGTVLTEHIISSDNPYYPGSVNAVNNQLKASSWFSEDEDNGISYYMFQEETINDELFLVWRQQTGSWPGGVLHYYNADRGYDMLTLDWSGSKNYLVFDMILIYESFDYDAFPGFFDPPEGLEIVAVHE